MSKRPGQVGPPPQAPPLPPGPPPPNDPNAQQAALQAAAWQQYYAAQGAQVMQSPSSAGASGSGSYANYGYGAGASMPGVSPSPASAGIVNNAGMSPGYASIAPGAAPVNPAAYGYPAGAAAYGQQAYMGMGQQQLGYGQPQYGQQGLGMGAMGMGMAPGMGMNMGMGGPGMGMYQQPGMHMGQQPYGGQQQYGMQGQQPNHNIGQAAGSAHGPPGQFNPSQQAQHGPVQAHGLPSRPATGGAPGGSIPMNGQPGPMAGPSARPPQGQGNFPLRTGPPGPSGPPGNQPYHPPGPGNTNNRGPQQVYQPQVPGSRGPFDPRNIPVRAGDDFSGGPVKRQRTDGPPPNLGIVPRDSVAARPQVPGSRGPYDPRNNPPPPPRHPPPDEERRAALEIRERDPRDIRGGSDYGGSHDGYRDSGRDDYRPPRGGRGGAGGRGASGAYVSRDSRDGGRYEDRRSGGDYDRGSGGRGGRGGPALRGASRGGRGGGQNVFPVRAGLPGSSPAPPTGPKGKDAIIMPKANGVIGMNGGSPAGRSASGLTGAGGKVPSGPAKDLEMEKVRDETAKETLRHRTLTDFKIIGLEIKALNWSWGQVRDDSTENAAEDADENDDDNEEDEIENGFGSTFEEDDEEDDAEEEDVKPAPPRPLKRERSVEEEAMPLEGTVKADSAEPPAKIHKTEPDTAVEPAADESAPPSRRSSAAESSEVAEAIDVPTETPDAPATPQPKIEPKTGEKRKAKMSSPDLDDDALIVSKKRIATESAVARNGQTPSKPPASSSAASIPAVKNRFRIYFDSLVAAPEPPFQVMDPIQEDENLPEGINPDEFSGEPEAAELATIQHEQQDQIDEGADVSMPEVQLPGESAADESTSQSADLAAAPTEGSHVDIELKVEDGAGTAETSDRNGDAAAPQPKDARSDPPASDGMDATFGIDSQVEPFTAAADSSPAIESTEAIKPDVFEDSAPPATVINVVPLEVSVIAKATATETGSEDTSSEPVDGSGPQAAELDAIAPAEGPADDFLPASADAGTAASEAMPEESSEAKDDVAVAADAALADDELAKQAAALKASAENTVAAYTQRAQRTKDTPASGSDPNSIEFRRSPSLPPTSASTPLPSASRLSILYDNGSRRMCVDSGLVERLTIHRKKGIIRAQLRLSIKGAQEKRDEAVEDISQKTEEIDVTATSPATEDVKDESMGSDTAAEDEAETKGPDDVLPTAEPKWELTEGLMLELHDTSTGTFTQLTTETLRSVWSVDPDSDPTSDEAFPPLHNLVKGMIPGEPIRLTAYLDQERALTEPKWVKTGQVEEWIRSGSKIGAARKGEVGVVDSWTGKIDVIDPVAPVNLVNVLDLWAEGSKLGIIKERRRFIQTHLMLGRNPLQILLRLVRGPDPPLTRQSIPHLFSPLDKAIALDAEYADRQSVSSLAVLAIANLAREFAEKVGEAAGAGVDKRMADVVKALPNRVMFPICDELFVEWARSNQRVVGNKKGGKR